MARTLGLEDRQKAVDQLAQGRTAGRLDAAEYGRRVDLVLTAETPAQLHAALGRPGPVRRAVRRRRGVRPLLVLAVWGAVMVVVAMLLLPAPNFGDDVAFGPATTAVETASVPAVASTVPPPGPVQPPDPGMATVAVRQTVAEAFDGGVDRAIRVAAIEDGVALVPVMQQVAENFPTQSAENRTTVLEAVFLSDVRAWVRLNFTTLGERTGEVAVVGGRWVVTRATACEIYAAAGAVCP